MSHAKLRRSKKFHQSVNNSDDHNFKLPPSSDDATLVRHRQQQRAKEGVGGELDRLQLRTICSRARLQRRRFDVVYVVGVRLDSIETSQTPFFLLAASHANWKQKWHFFGLRKKDLKADSTD